MSRYQFSLVPWFWGTKHMLKMQHWASACVSEDGLGGSLLDCKLLLHYRRDSVFPECTHWDSHSPVPHNLAIFESSDFTHKSICLCCLQHTHCGSTYIILWKLIHGAAWILGKSDGVNCMGDRNGGFGAEFRLWHCVGFTERYPKIFPPMILLQS